MKKYLLHIVLFFCIVQLLNSQEDGVVAFNIPARNSLKFNRQFINPTFSFVREQNKYISFNNKREWVQFNGAPQTYLFGYSGRFQENIGAGVSLFQQNYGVLTTFGGVVNFAYNAVLNRDSNLTFGMNLGFYKSGLNEGNVVTNVPDSALDNIPSNSIITLNPGINYGTEFLDFGVSINNFVSYNLTSSRMIEDNPEQGIKGHIMYTGYMNARGFFDESRFTGLVSSEFRKDQTILTGMIMLNVPKGIWGQIGYNSLYAISAGIGLNVTSQIAIEYNYENGVGGFSSFGNSHDITVAFKFINRNRYDYAGDDEEEALLISPNRKARSIAKRRKTSKSESNKKTKPTVVNNDEIKAEEVVIAKTQTESVDELNKEEQARIAEAARLKAEEDAKAKLAEEARIQVEQEEQARIAEAARLKAEEAAKAKLAEEARIQAEQEEQARIAEAARLKAEEDAKAKLVEEARIQVEQEEQARITEATRLKAEEAAKAIETSAVNEDIQSLNDLKKSADEVKNKQQYLLDDLSNKIAGKQQDLDDLKEENDLRDQGIVKAPKAFKSVSAENAAIESLKLKIDNSVVQQDAKITEIEKLYRQRLKKVRKKNDATNQAYLNAIETLKSEREQTITIKKNLEANLEDIKVATAYERSRRIKKAAYDNDDDRYNKDRATLERIKKFTEPNTEPLTEKDFDYGDPLSNIQIVKDVSNADEGYYLVVAVHTNIEKRDKFLEKAVAAGEKNINFFFDVNTSKYYIYYEKFDNISQAKSSLDNSKGSKPYNSKMSMVKIEN